MAKRGLRIVLYLLLAALLILTDQEVKQWAFESIRVNGPLTVIPGILQFYYAENVGAAFSMLMNQKWLFLIIGSLTGCAIAYVLFRLSAKGEKENMFNRVILILSMIFILSGDIGNMIDRVKLGFVIDYIRVLFINFPIFNIADCLIVVGCGMLLVFGFFRKTMMDVFFDKMGWSKDE
ncbi:MAG: signal peptidase II [Firmicutes bacterium]|nr:signal peptidase II [Bacillota bacterium]